MNKGPAFKNKMHPRKEAILRAARREGFGIIVVAGLTLTNS